jgi:Cu(I)/Ag(I) efflux system membrane fusion protein
MKTFRIVLIALLILAALAGWYGYGRWYGPRAVQKPVPQQERKILYYHCPMHPNYHSDKPGDCPICGMRLEPVYATGVSASSSEQILISPERQQLIGMRFGQAAIETASRTLRANGKVEMDETRIVRIHPKVDGWIEDVEADFTGKFVRRGQPLVTIYSPELLASQQEYLLALKAKDVLKRSTVPGVASDNTSLVEAARRRLELWDLTAAQIQDIERTGKPARTVTLYSPSSGYIIARNAYPSQRVTPETELYSVADLSQVWVMADVFEYEASSIRPGQAAAVTPAYELGRPLAARVSYIQPSLDPATRTLRVRLELSNPGLLLKPEMFVNVEFRLSAPPSLFVPGEAVLNSGLRKTVFVDQGSGRLEPREVETGREFGDKVEILKGLAAGERIVTSGTFLVDSESQLSAAAYGAHQHDQPGH